ncbi:type IV pilin protein [Massilia sp. PAMC28688]|uniref:type IV pilin protein n=1 Tax=Massilia sp. PAMC28688 TaxID=2861283 RepID=UPI001C6306AF|nr:type IV pilin protein [Massilia sp. PAMC28688]QYF93886.1 type IV pilin protein [Massilia sp. PAMC28688]
MKPMQAFSLVELLVVMAIVAILAMLAYPSYTNYLVKARRAEAQMALLTLMQQQENFYTLHNTYVAFSAESGEGDARRFRWWSGDTPQASAYELSGQACLDQPLERCIELRAIPGTSRVNPRFRDPGCETLTLDSIGQRAATGPMARCWP